MCLKKEEVDFKRVDLKENVNICTTDSLQRLTCLFYLLIILVKITV